MSINVRALICIYIYILGKQGAKVEVINKSVAKLYEVKEWERERENINFYQQAYNKDKLLLPLSPAL